MRKDKLNYKVYIEWVNYWGEVTQKDLIAAFWSEGWAKHFVESIKKDDDTLTRYVIEYEA